MALLSQFRADCGRGSDISSATHVGGSLTFRPWLTCPPKLDPIFAYTHTETHLSLTLILHKQQPWPPLDTSDSAPLSGPFRAAVLSPPQTEILPRSYENKYLSLLMYFSSTHPTRQQWNKLTPLLSQRLPFSLIDVRRDNKLADLAIAVSKGATAAAQQAGALTPATGRPSEVEAHAEKSTQSSSGLGVDPVCLKHVVVWGQGFDPNEGAHASAVQECVAGWSSRPFFGVWNREVNDTAAPMPDPQSLLNSGVEEVVSFEGFCAINSSFKPKEHPTALNSAGSLQSASASGGAEGNTSTPLKVPEMATASSSGEKVRARAS
eukprot:1155857-Pelagomonas_calceolata.AAC.1